MTGIVEVLVELTVRVEVAERVVVMVVVIVVVTVVVDVVPNLTYVPPEQTMRNPAMCPTRALSSIDSTCTVRDFLSTTVPARA